MEKNSHKIAEPRVHRGGTDPLLKYKKPPTGCWFNYAQDPEAPEAGNDPYLRFHFICGLEASFPGPIVIFLLRSRNIIDICDHKKSKKVLYPYLHHIVKGYTAALVNGGRTMARFKTRVAPKCTTIEA
jgi:hypothetical protein